MPSNAKNAADFFFRLKKKRYMGEKKEKQKTYISPKGRIFELRVWDSVV